LDTSFSVTEQLVGEASAAGLVIRGIGIGMPEYVSRTGVVTSSEVLDWMTQPAVRFASLGEVRVDSDVRCGALAEATLGAGRGLSSFAYISVGTGLSFTLVIDGQPWQGHRGEAIALGEFPVDGFSNSDATGLEAYSSGGGMQTRYAAVSGKPPAGRLIDLAIAGDQLANDIIVSGAETLGRCLASLASLLDPQAFVLGGGLGTSNGPWQTALRTSYDRAVSARSEPPMMLAAGLGPDSGAIGAALLPHARSTKRV
jgi:glucokinase